MTFNIFFVIGLVILIPSVLWNIFEFRKIRKLLLKQKQANDYGFDKYLDLKYQIQFIITIGAVLSFLVGYLGFDTRESLIKQSKEGIGDIQNLKNQRDSTQKLLDSTMGNVKFLNMFIESVFNVKITNIQKSLTSMSDEASVLKNKISDLTKEISLPKIYIFENISLSSTKKEYPGRIYFNSLPKAKNGQKLPILNSVPNIFFTYNGHLRRILNVTKEYFELDSQVCNYCGEQGVGRRDLWLTFYE